MNDSRKTQSTNPIFDPKVECYSRTALTGLASFWFVFSTTHFLQKPLRRRLGYPVAGSLVLSITLAGSATYYITKSYFENFSKLSSQSETEVEN